VSKAPTQAAPLKEPEKAPAQAVAKPKAAPPKNGFKLSEFIVYPAHGVGQIIGVEVQEVAGFSLELYVVSFIKDKMILKVPTSKVTAVGMRKLAETNIVEKALSTLSGRARVKRTMWSRRAQEYEAKINSRRSFGIFTAPTVSRNSPIPSGSFTRRRLIAWRGKFPPFAG
jgi:CarD family transcriptional regulator